MIEKDNYRLIELHMFVQNHRQNEAISLHQNSFCSLAFKLMHENSINFLLVENDEKKITGIVTESSLLEIVSRNSFKETVKNNITKVLPEETGKPTETHFVYPASLKNNARLMAFRNFIFTKVNEWKF